MSTATATLLPITCTPWCAEGDGHPDAPSASEQACVGTEGRVLLSLHPQADDGNGQAAPAYLTTYLRRSPGHAAAVVVRFGDGGAERSMTPTEARHLIEALGVALREEAL